MLKICGSSTYGPLELIFKEALSTGLLPSDWRKGNIVPIQKKCDRQILKNNRLVSLLPICGEIFERLIFNNLFIFLLKITIFHQISLGSNLEILALINYYLKRTKFAIHLMRNWKSEESFWTFLKPLIKCGTKGVFLNYRKIAHLVTSGKYLLLSVKHLSGKSHCRRSSRFHFGTIVISDRYK